MPRQISKLTCLQTLPNFVVGKGNSGSSLREIRHLSHLQGELCISKLENVVEVGDAEIANLIGKPGLHKLSLKWSKNFDDSRNGRIEFEVFNMLRPCNMLKEFIIECYVGEKFPTWLEFLHLRELSISQCHGLNSLHEAIIFNKTVFLESLKICSCESLTSIVKGQLPPTIKRLTIKNCKNLQNVVDEGEDSTLSVYKEDIKSNENVSLLVYLNIDECLSLKFFSSRSRGDLPATLKSLIIYNWSELTSLSLPAPLKILLILHCPKLESVELDRLVGNSSLESIEIWDCEKLKSLPEGLHNLYHLNTIIIGGCSSFVSFSNGGLLPTNLKELRIINCEKLEALPNRMYNLTSLHILSIVGCPGIVSIPEEGFPTSLIVLKVSALNICKPLLEWGLHRLTSLKELDISGKFSDWVSFPQGGEDGKMMLLSTSLNRITIHDFPNLEFLSSKCFQDLSALKFLQIRDCPKLTSIPHKALPPSLLEISVIRCPLLKQHWKKDEGRE